MSGPQDSIAIGERSARAAASQPQPAACVSVPHDREGEQPLLSVRDVSHTVGDTHVLEGISFDVFRGEIFGIMGMSGSGKTTLLRLLIGLDRPTSGRILFKDRDITQLDEFELNEVRRSMGMCFQYSALFDSMTVAENVAFTMRNRRDVPRAQVNARVNELLDLVEMAGTGHRMPADLSGGMKKRVGIARALMQQPELVFYDEPSSGLDPVMACNITGLIKRVSEDLGSTAVIVSHDVEHLLAMAHRVLMLHDRHVQVIGTPEELRACEIPIVHQFVHGLGTGPGAELCPAR
mgnify:CR=1 FL=1